MFAVRLSRNQDAQPSNGAGLTALCVIDAFHTCFIDVLQGRPALRFAIPSPPLRYPQKRMRRKGRRAHLCKQGLPCAGGTDTHRLCPWISVSPRPRKRGPTRARRSKSICPMGYQERAVMPAGARFALLPRCGSPYLSDLERCLGIAPSPGESSLPP